MRKYLFALLILLNLFCGCQAFRKSFEDGHKLRRRPRKNAASPAARPHRRGDTGDQVFDTVFGKSRREVRGTRSDLLSDREQNMVKHLYAAPRPEDDPDVRRINQKNRNTRQKDWVFGTKNGSYTKF